MSWIRSHSLSLVAAILFMVALVGQVLVGRAVYNQDQRDHGGAEVGLVSYLGTGHFGEATFENWESEFLQMAVFIALTAVLVQRGSAESRKPEDEPGAGQGPGDEPPEAHRYDPRVPWPVRRGGLALAVYRRSLSLALFLLFLGSMAGHLIAGLAEANQQAREHGGQVMSLGEFLMSSEFWFQSLQNWQSEFLSVWAIAVLSIWLRQDGSPESKPVHAPHEQTGAESP